MNASEEENAFVASVPSFFGLQEESLMVQAGNTAGFRPAEQHQIWSRYEKDAQTEGHAAPQAAEAGYYSATSNSSAAETRAKLSLVDREPDECRAMQWMLANRTNTPVFDAQEEQEHGVPVPLRTSDCPYLDHEGTLLGWDPQWLCHSLPHTDFYALYSYNQMSSFCFPACHNALTASVPEYFSSVPACGDASLQSRFEPQGTCSLTPACIRYSPTEEDQNLLRSFWAFTGGTCPRLPLSIRAAVPSNCSPAPAEESLLMHVPTSCPPCPSNSSSAASYSEPFGCRQKSPRLKQRMSSHRERKRKKTEGRSRNGAPGRQGSTRSNQAYHGRKTGVELKLSPLQTSTPSLSSPAAELDSLTPCSESPGKLPEPVSHPSISASHEELALCLPDMQRLGLLRQQPVSAVSSCVSFSPGASHRDQTGFCRPPPRAPHRKRRPRRALTERSTRGTGNSGGLDHPIPRFVSSLLGPLADVEWRNPIAGFHLSNKFGYLRCDRTGEPVFSHRWEGGCEGVLFDNQKSLWKVRCYGKGKVLTKSFSPKLLGGFEAAKTVATLYRIRAAEREEVLTQKLRELALDWKQHQGEPYGVVNLPDGGIPLSGTTIVNRENLMIPSSAGLETVVDGILRNEGESGKDSPESLLNAAMIIVSQMQCQHNVAEGEM
ncbi:AP2 domain transcription factor AP2XII-3 [Toxoplasma gondii RUB]|uniref:AP2 domain transcription factor AP2XII-3 n=1 Tax=Toxoplasma gondii RUB TaxID=935652 RepID=A0A086M6Q6_TOXGO|nr:AP2 domain transcription factor AP2XII-3 [Toxoplasma gondii RUB]